MRLQNRQQVQVILAIGSVALLALNQLVLNPLTAKWHARADRIADLRKSVTQGRLLRERASSIHSVWDRMSTNALSPDLSVAENQLLKAFDRWSQESQVGVNNIKPQRKRGGPDHALVECRVDAFGNLSALSRFLYNVERDPLGVKIEVVEITSRDDNGEQLTLGLQVSGLAFQPVEKR